MYVSSISTEISRVRLRNTFDLQLDISAVGIFALFIDML